MHVPFQALPGGGRAGLASTDPHRSIYTIYYSHIHCSTSIVHVYTMVHSAGESPKWQAEVYMCTYVYIPHRVYRYMKLHF